MPPDYSRDEEITMENLPKIDSKMKRFIAMHLDGMKYEEWKTLSQDVRKQKMEAVTGVLKLERAYMRALETRE